MSSKFHFTGFSFFVSLVAAIGGLLFGFNTSIISGAILFIAQEFSLTVFEQELVVSTVLIGALIGAFIGGFIADGIGRKKTLFVTLILFFFGTLTLEYSASFGWLLLGRLITGIAIGIASMAVPLYIAEMSPRESRGALVSLNQLLITIGILVAYVVSFIFAEKHDWRDMFGFGYLPIILQFIGLLFIPETPSWLYSRNKVELAEKVLGKLKMNHSHEMVKEAHHETKNGVKLGWTHLFSKSVRKPLFVGIGMSVFQQITGINTVIYYAPKIFQSAGYQSAQAAIFATMLVGIVNVFFTIIALWLIDKVGRRTLLIGGLIGMGFSLALLGWSFVSGKMDISGVIAVVGLMIYVAFFAISLGPVAWLIISEIFPLRIRGRGMGISTFANWTCNYIVSLTFLSLIEAFGTGPTFWIYAVICIIGLWFVYRMVPETRGKSFEEIQEFWKS